MNMLSAMPTMGHKSVYTKGETLLAARDFHMAFGHESTTIAKGSKGKVVSETGEPLVVEFKDCPPVSIPMSDAESFLSRPEMSTSEDRKRSGDLYRLSESLIQETKHRKKVNESSGRPIRVTKIDPSFAMRPFSIIPFGMESLVGKEGEIIFEYMEMNGRKVYQCNFAEAGRVALADSEFEYVDGGKSGSLDNKNESTVRRSLRHNLAEDGDTSETKIIRGDKLHPDVRKEVLSSFVHRKKPDGTHWDGSKSDDEWVKNHAFHVTAKNKLSRRHKWAEPHYMADESVNESMCTRCGNKKAAFGKKVCSACAAKGESVVDDLEEAKGPSCWSALSVPCNGKAGEKCSRCGHTINGKRQQARLDSYKKSVGKDYGSK